MTTFILRVSIKCCMFPINPFGHHGSYKVDRSHDNEESEGQKMENVNGKS